MSTRTDDGMHSKILGGEVSGSTAWLHIGTISKKLPELLDQSEPADAYNLLVNLCAKLSRARGGFAILKQNGAYELQFWKERHKDTKSPVQMPSATGKIAEALEKDEPSLLNEKELSGDPWWVLIVEYIGDPPRQLLCVPMKTPIRNNPGGVFVYSKLGDPACYLGFNAYDKKILTICVTICIKALCLHLKGTC